MKKFLLAYLIIFAFSIAYPSGITTIGQSTQTIQLKKKKKFKQESDQTGIRFLQMGPKSFHQRKL